MELSSHFYHSKNVGLLGHRILIHPEKSLRQNFVFQPNTAVRTQEEVAAFVHETSIGRGTL